VPHICVQFFSELVKAITLKAKACAFDAKGIGSAPMPLSIKPEQKLRYTGQDR